MKTYIVLIPVSNSVVSPRRACEMIENTKFDGLTEYDILKKVMFELGIDEPHNIEVDLITDFMDRINNEDIDMDLYFMSYVYSN